MDEEINVKAAVDWCYDKNEFMLDINGEPLENHMYLDPNFDPDDLQIKYITADVRINDLMIINHEMTQEWH